MKKIFQYLPSIIFNIAETIIILTVGILMGVSIKEISIIFMLFIIVRILLKNPLHYKDWYRCMLWSLLLFVSFFMVARVSLLISLLSVVFSAYILTQMGNIEMDKMY